VALSTWPCEELDTWQNRKLESLEQISSRKRCDREEYVRACGEHGYKRHDQPVRRFACRRSRCTHVGEVRIVGLSRSPRPGLFPGPFLCVFQWPNMWSREVCSQSIKKTGLFSLSFSQSVTGAGETGESSSRGVEHEQRWHQLGLAARRCSGWRCWGPLPGRRQQASSGHATQPRIASARARGDAVADGPSAATTARQSREAARRGRSTSNSKAASTQHQDTSRYIPYTCSFSLDFYLLNLNFVIVQNLINI
jgi:hypothetical protein